MTRRRTPTRPYARKRGGPPSVTTILGVIAADGLAWGASKEAAIFAVMHQDKWQDLDVDKAIDRIRVHFRGLWDGRAAMGTLVHAVNELWAWDTDADLGAEFDKIMEGKRPPKIWEGRKDEVLAQAAGYVDGLERFWTDCNPVTIQTEEVVREPAKPLDFIGQRDWVCVIDGTRYLIDLKTTAEQDYEKAVYADSWRLQIAGYRYAPEVVIYDPESEEEVGTEPNEDVERTAVLHMRGDGGYQLLEVQAGPEEYQRFLTARALYQWAAKDSKKPAPVIVRPELIAAEAGAA